ncbi:MAG: hypothetical protein ACI8RZ_005157 [Myxococcota bacterium]|jgi:hypothetical protein
MKKAEIKTCQVKPMKLKRGGCFVYYFDKADSRSDSQGHSLVISKKASEAILAFKGNKKKDTRATHGTFFFDPSQSKFLFGLGSGDASHLQNRVEEARRQGGAHPQAGAHPGR